MSTLTFTLPSLPGLTFEAVPLDEPPPDNSLVFLYAKRRMVAVARFEAGVWHIAHRRFVCCWPTHWIKPNRPVCRAVSVGVAPPGSGRCVGQGNSAIQTVSGGATFEATEPHD